MVHLLFAEQIISSAKITHIQRRCWAFIKLYPKHICIMFEWRFAKCGIAD